MGDIYFTPVTGFLFGLIACSWLVLIGWVGWRWLAQAWHLPWPMIVVIQSIFAVQIIWLFRLMNLNLYFPPLLLAWLEIPASVLFWLAVFPWFILSNLLSLTPLAVRLGLHYYPDIVDMFFDYGLFYVAINGLLLYRNSRRKQAPMMKSGPQNQS
jgi:hypothetical protein